MVFVVFEGKQDMHKELPRKLRSWMRNSDRLVILRDQDSADCSLLKSELRALCVEAGRRDVLVRIACRQLESWYAGDWGGVARAFGRPTLARLDRKAKYRDPDSLGNPFDEIRRELPVFQKVSGGRQMGRFISLTGSRSASFDVFLRGLDRFTRLD